MWTSYSNNQMAGKRKCSGGEGEPVGRNEKATKGKMWQSIWASSQFKEESFSLETCFHRSPCHSIHLSESKEAYLQASGHHLWLYHFLFNKVKDSFPNVFCPLPLKVLNLPPGQSKGLQMGCRAPSRWQYFWSSVGCRFLSLLSAQSPHQAEFLL